MTKINNEECRVVRVLKHAQRHQRELGEARFTVDEDGNCDNAKHKEANDLGRIPGKDDTAEVEADEDQQGEGEDANTATPVNGLEAGYGWGARVMHVEENE